MSRRNDVKPVVKQQVVRNVVGVEDMVLLPDIKDSGIVANLKLRLQSELIYTSIGHVLVVCNPYKWLPIYGEDVMKRYTLQQRVDVPPHIFATAEAAYRNMIQEEDNQCVIISGESGAGKTEASKQIQAYIAKVSGGGPKVEQTKKVFLESNPVLEAFGNAKTLRNNNSSRFGKYFELKFDRFGAPIGGLVTNYLLEKSRIVNPGRGERNFHIFYQLLNSQLAESLGVKEPAASFAYLSAGGGKAVKVDGVDDSQEMEVTLKAMKSVGMKNGQTKSILSLVGAILHLGNIEFESIQMEGVEGCRVLTKASTVSGAALRRACELMGVDAKAFVRCLTVRELTTMAPGGRTESYQIPQHSAQAAARRDAIAKAIYEHLFDLIVERINVALDPAKAEEAVNHEVDLEVDVLSIGVLDIYGFEVFEHNSFEQLCINYVNEKLQQIFIELTLNAEQIEYESEGIAWTPIPFFNNKIVCDLLDGARPSGLFRVLDDTCKTMHGTKAGLEVDKKFLDSARQLHGNNAHFRSATNAFVVKHYAGDVTYDAGKLGESNKDALDNDLLGIIKSSTDKLLTHLFRNLEVQDNSGGSKGGSVLPSAGTRIRHQCQLLVTALMECSPHYVRCVKSNDTKTALTMDGPRVQHQAKYLGLAENIKVRRAGFAYRNNFHRFLDRFGILSSTTYPEWRGTDLNGCKEILRAIQRMQLPAGLNLKNEVQLGMTKLFIRTPEMYFAIEQLRDKAFERYVEVIQRAYRKYRNSRELVSLQNAMHALYEGQQKMRRRESIYCPFSGDSLNQLNAAFLDPLTAAAPARRTPAQETAFKTTFKVSMYRIIDYYNPKEVVLFVDPHAAQIVKSVHPSSHSSSGSGGGPVLNLLPAQAAGCSVLSRVLVLTDRALYIMEKLTPEGWRHMQAHAKVTPAEAAHKRPPGMLLLRRRISLPHAGKNSAGQTGILHSIVLSKLADCCVLLQVAPPASSLLPAAQVLAGLKKTWAKDDSSVKCSVSGEPFSLFNRRHHCRVSGHLVCQEASMHAQLLPDVQLYTPQRVGDHVLGLVSCDPLEDTVVLTARKTEFAALIATQCLGHVATQKVTPALLSSVITFQNTFKLRPNSYVPGNISLMPGIEVQIRAVSPPVTKPPPAAPASKGGKGSKKSAAAASGTAASLCILDGFTAALESGGKLVVSCSTDGISHQAVLERRERQLLRQKRAAKRRRREEKERHERRAAREAEREQQRLQRLAERKVKKLAERHARRRRAEIASGLSQSTKGLPSNNSLTRLAAEPEPRGGRRSPAVAPSSGSSDPRRSQQSQQPEVTYQTPTKASRAPRASEVALPRDSEASYVTAVGDEPPLPPPSVMPGSGYKPRSVMGVPLAMGGTGAGAGEELMAAMARRRAKNQHE